jgi:outer membrane lipoprotein carrier protein
MADMIHVLSVFCGLLVIGAQPPAARSPVPPAAELARALQKKYDAIHDFSADFVHTYEGGVLRKRATERGTVLIKKPGKMRWTYTAPEQKLFVSDGRKVYSYIPEDKQVIVSSVPAGDQATTPALFLAGKGDLSRDFTPRLTDVPGAPVRTYALKLTPKKSDLEYDSLTLVVDRDSLQIRMLVTSDAQGGRSSFAFTNLKENAGLPDKEFVFKIPRWVDVITDDRSTD